MPVFYTQSKYYLVCIQSLYHTCLDGSKNVLPIFTHGLFFSRPPHVCLLVSPLSPRSFVHLYLLVYTLVFPFTRSHPCLPVHTFVFLFTPSSSHSWHLRRLIQYFTSLFSPMALTLFPPLRKCLWTVANMSVYPSTFLTAFCSQVLQAFI